MTLPQLAAILTGVTAVAVLLGIAAAVALAPDDERPVDDPSEPDFTVPDELERA